MAVGRIHPNTPAYRKLVAEWERVASYLIDSEGDVVWESFETGGPLEDLGSVGLIQLDAEMRKMENKFLRRGARLKDTFVIQRITEAAQQRSDIINEIKRVDFSTNF